MYLKVFDPLNRISYHSRGRIFHLSDKASRPLSMDSLALDVFLGLMNTQLKFQGRVEVVFINPPAIGTMD
jgi:hypothetical protein